MSQKYQNEKSPILNGLKKPKTPGKVQKIRDLEGPTAFRPFENTLYTRAIIYSHHTATTTTNICMQCEDEDIYVKGTTARGEQKAELREVIYISGQFMKSQGIMLKICLYLS